MFHKDQLLYKVQLLHSCMIDSLLRRIVFLDRFHHQVMSVQLMEVSVAWMEAAEGRRRWAEDNESQNEEVYGGRGVTWNIPALGRVKTVSTFGKTDV